LEYLLISKLSLLKGAFNPAMHGSRMNLFDASDCFITQAFHEEMDCTRDFIFRGLKVIESRPVSVAEGLATELASKDCRHSIAGRIRAMIFYVVSRWRTSSALRGKRLWLFHGRNSLPLTYQ
jgi:hypothetical protein